MFTACIYIKQGPTNRANCFGRYNWIFFFIKICFLISFTSKNFDFTVFENQAFNVSIVNFNSTENNSAREVDFSRANTTEAASFS